MRSRETARRQRLSAERRDSALLAGQILVNVITVSLFSNYFNTRFLIPSLPACYILSARAVSRIHRLDRMFGTATLALLLTTNVLYTLPYMAMKWSGVPPALLEPVVKPPVPYFKAGWNWPFSYRLADYLAGSRFRSYLAEFVGEATSDFDDANEGMVRFLWNYADPGDTVFVYGPDYETVIYYTGLRVVNRLDPSWRPWPLVYKKYPNARGFAHLTDYPPRLVDWVIVRPIIYNPEESAGPFFWEDARAFAPVEVDYPEVPMTPDIWYHTFRPSDGPGFRVYRNLLTTRSVPDRVGKAELDPEHVARNGSGEPLSVRDVTRVGFP